MANADSASVWRTWKTSIMVGIVALVVGAILAIFGVLSWPHMLAVVALVVALHYVSVQGNDNEPKPWPHPPVRFRRGARSEIARLAWSTVDRDGDVTAPTMQRVRDLARSELATRGVVWSGQQGDPMLPTAQAQQLIGSAAVTTLTTNKPVRPRALENVVSKLELLRSAQ